MSSIHLKRLQEAISNQDGESILKSLNTHGIEHPQACGGRAKCSTCRVIVYEGLDKVCPRNSAEQAIANRLGFEADVRLACQSTISGDVKIKRPVYDETDIKIASRDAGNKSEQFSGQEQEISALFCDIAEYTKFTDKNPPYDVVHILNRYFFMMGGIISRNKGRIIDVYGDGFLAVFGVSERDNYAIDAVEAALEIENTIKTDFQNYLLKYFGQCFTVRIGINTGPVILGSVNVHDQRKFVAVGDAVNIASRIEQANKETKTSLLVSQSTLEQLDNRFVCGKSSKIKVKGKDEALLLTEIVGKT